MPAVLRVAPRKGIAETDLVERRSVGLSELDR